RARRDSRRRHGRRGTLGRTLLALAHARRRADHSVADDGDFAERHSAAIQPAHQGRRDPRHPAVAIRAAARATVAQARAAARPGAWRVIPGRRHLPLLITACLLVLLFFTGAAQHPGFGSVRVALNLLTDNAFLAVA